METGVHTLSALFEQLGLPNQTHEIEGFIAQHRLPEGTPLSQAPFWSSAQSALLAEGLAADADWAEVIDGLAARLS
jgi:hypothetical protein